MFNPNISDYVRGFGMDEIQDEQDYEEWVQAGKPECVPVACPARHARSDAGGGVTVRGVHA
jgi:hypothetical protein